MVAPNAARAVPPNDPPTRILPAWEATTLAPQATPPALRPAAQAASNASSAF